MTSVKYYHSGMTGAPTLDGQASSVAGFINVLDGCLVNGFGTGIVDSVVVNGNVATVTRAAGHPFEQHTIVELSGVTSPSALNGQFRVLSITSTTYTFATSGISDQTATGTISHKLAPAGWTKPFSGTHLAAYKSSNVTSTGCYLRVNDNFTYYSLVRGYETMSDVNTGTGLFPLDTQISGGGFWLRSNTTNSTTRPWVVIASDKLFYISIAYYHSNYPTSYQTYCFGDFHSRKSPDAYACMLQCHASNVYTNEPGTAAYSDVAYIHHDTSQYLYAPRGVSGLGSAVSMIKNVLISPYGSNAGRWSGASGPLFPNPADNNLFLSSMSVNDNSAFRGIIPGAYYIPQNVGKSVYAIRAKLLGTVEYPSKVFLSITNGTGFIFFDITGPW